MGFSRQESCSGWPLPSPGDFPNPGVDTRSPTLQADSLPSEKSVQFSHSVMSESLWPHGLQNARLLSPSPNPRAYSNSCLSSRWCHPTISSSVIPYSSCIQSLPASGSFLMSRLFASSGKSIGASSVLPMNIQYWFPLGWIGWLSLPSKGLSRVLSNTTVQKY